MFFRITGLSDQGEAVGAQGVPLSPGRSIAVDKLHVYGTPFFIQAELPIDSDKATTRFRRLMIAQDTGSAINGPARADLYWGAGDTAGRIAGRIRQQGQFVMLLPRELDMVEAGRHTPLPPVKPVLVATKGGAQAKARPRPPRPSLQLEPIAPAAVADLAAAGQTAVAVRHMSFERIDHAPPSAPPQRGRAQALARRHPLGRAAQAQAVRLRCAPRRRRPRASACRRPHPPRRRAEPTAARQPAAKIALKPAAPKPVLPVIGLDRRQKQRLARGTETIDSRIDLHGKTQSEAHLALLRLPASCPGAGRALRPGHHRQGPR